MIKKYLLAVLISLYSVANCMEVPGALDLNVMTVADGQAIAYQSGENFLIAKLSEKSCSLIAEILKSGIQLKAHDDLGNSAVIRAISPSDAANGDVFLSLENNNQFGEKIGKMLDVFAKTSDAEKINKLLLEQPVTQNGYENISDAEAVFSLVQIEKEMDKKNNQQTITSSDSVIYDLASDAAYVIHNAFEDCQTEEIIQISSVEEENEMQIDESLDIKAFKTKKSTKGIGQYKKNSSVKLVVKPSLITLISINIKKIIVMKSHTNVTSRTVVLALSEEMRSIGIKKLTVMKDPTNVTSRIVVQVLSERLL